MREFRVGRARAGVGDKIDKRDLTRCPRTLERWSNVLRLMTTRTGIRFQIEILSSRPLIPNDPPPWTTTTCLPGLATLARNPKGRPTPIAPKVPILSRCRGKKVGID
jgi:hypothetical protein